MAATKRLKRRIASSTSVDDESKQQFTSGATRSISDIALNLIPKSAIIALGRRLAFGAIKHGENNWRRGAGDEQFRAATISHLLAHIFDYLERGDRVEANTDAIITNAAFLCEFEAQSPYRPNHQQQKEQE